MFRRDKWWHREIEKMRRENAAREADLVATICHLSGKPLPTPSVEREAQPERVKYAAAPEQYPD